MSLVRGEGEVCQSNQWSLAKAGAVEEMAAAMRLFRHHPMVQLSALLCFIPLALENPMMQVHGNILVVEIQIGLQDADWPCTFFTSA